MKKYLIILLVLLLPSFAYGVCVETSPTWTCDSTSTAAQVQAAIYAADDVAGGTVILGSGTHTWNNYIIISGPVVLQGQGIDVTIINTTYSSSCGSAVGQFLINVAPTCSANPIIRITGFTLNSETVCGILYTNSDVDDKCTNVRMDHLKLNMNYPQYTLIRVGLSFGVMDNCIITGMSSCNQTIMDTAGGRNIWSTNDVDAAYEFGDNGNFYIEDCEIHGFTHAGNGAGRYAFRYNDIIWDMPGSCSIVMFDQHGDHGGAGSGMGAEIYGNDVTEGAGISGNAWYSDARGGKWLVFNNKLYAAGGWRVKEEDGDVTINGYCEQPYNSQPQHISNTYVWSNWAGANISNADDSDTHQNCSCCGLTNVPTENRDFYNYNASFNGTTGVGCGTLASRPATCTTGVGYWATNQSCTSLTGMVGVDPTTPISGTLYKCTATNTWTAYYTPYTYPHPLRGRQFYVSPSGSGTTCTSGSPCALSYANTNAVAGDTVYLTGTSYTTSYIAPTNSGTASARIIYQNDTGATPSIDSQDYVVYLNGNDYITVTGINGTNFSQGVVLTNAANNNIISYGTFGPAGNADHAWDTSYIRGNSQYNWIHHCTFYHGGENAIGPPGNDRGVVFEIGEDASNAHYAYYNLIEDSTFYHGGHHVFGLQVKYNTVRNNYFHNEAWENSYGNRVIYSNGYESGAGIGESLVEGNKIAYSYYSIDAPTSPVGIYVVASPYNIIRYNKIYHGIAYGVAFYTWPASPWDSRGAYNRFYNNTMFNNGWSYVGGAEDSAIWFGNTTYSIGNVLKNNLYYSHYQVYGGTTSGQTFANEFNGDVSGNPLFVNASTTPPVDKTDSTVPNLNLQSGSPAINAGGALTTVAVADTGSGTALYVSDARYFQYGQWAPAGTVSADWISVGTVSNSVQISSINYTTNIITLANTISRSDGDSVWLYKKSDGVQVLYDSAPAAGAYDSEISQSAQGCTISGASFR